jgi:hypothetical protein
MAFEVTAYNAYVWWKEHSVNMYLAMKKILNPSFHKFLDSTPRTPEKKRK